MKKQLQTLVCSALLISSGSLHAAETGNMVLTLPSTCLDYQLLHISPNGKWACGAIDNGTFSGWLWNLTTGELTELTQVGIASVAWQVSDNGVVAGTYTSNQATNNGADVEAQGYWQNGHWHYLSASASDQVTSYDNAGTAYAISGNGRYIGGQVTINGETRPVIWDNGVMTALDNYASKSPAGAVYSVDNNGNAAGWTYYPNSYGTLNRTCAIWTPQLVLPAKDKVWHLCEGRLSPNGRYAYAYDRIYDMQTGTTTALNLSNVFDYHLYGITDDGTIFGMYVPFDGTQTGCLVKDGKFISIDTYLSQYGVDLSSQYLIAQVNCISNDGKTIGAVAYDLEQLANGVERSLPIIIKLDENVTTREPAGIEALVLDGANAVKLYWRKPLAGADGVTGYELYRDGELLKAFDADVLTYTDTNVTIGEHSYTVKATYASATSVETEAAVATISANELKAPRDPLALQARVNDVRLMWDAPASTLPTLQYHLDDDDVTAVGWGTNSLECGTRFSADMLAAYGDGAQIVGITFYPMSEQLSWKANVYSTTDTSTPLYSESIDASSLTYGQMNTVKFNTPLTIPAGQDVIVAVEAKVASSTNNVFGRVTGKKRIGYTDLLRRVGVDTDFFSMYEKSMNRDITEATEDNTMWPLAALIAPTGRADANVTAYQVWEGDQLLATTDTTAVTLEGVSDGSHTYGIAALYGSNASEKSEVSVDVDENTDVYNISNLRATTNDNVITLTWDAPTNDDATDITYATDNSTVMGVQGSSTYNYSYTVGAIYSGAKLRAYKGYEIKSFKFFPLAKAYFSFTLTANGKQVVYKELNDDDYTIGQWNTIKLDNAIALDPNAEYQLSLECFEPEDGAAPIGMDSYMAYAGSGDLYKQGEDDFASLSDNSDNVVGNWMIGMTVGTSESSDLGVKGYNVRVGNVLTGESLLTASPIDATTYSYTATAKGSYTFRVSPVYDSPIGEQKGQTTTATISVSDGIAEVVSDAATLYPNPATTTVSAPAGTVRMQVYSLAGALVAEAKGNVLNVSNLSGGVYVVKVTTTSGEYNEKLTVRK